MARILDAVGTYRHPYLLQRPAVLTPLESRAKVPLPRRRRTDNRHWPSTRMSSPSSTPSENAASPGGCQRWWIGARPRTLSMALAPVLVGASIAWGEGVAPRLAAFALTSLCAVLIQVGTNLLNDVSDFERGNDRVDRVGPTRITAAGWATPREVKVAAAVVFGLALLCGAALVWLGGPAIFVLGLLSLLFAWGYSGGSHPVSHGPWGEVCVLLFFGLAAVCGSYYLQAGQWSLATLPAGLAMGSLAAAVLLLNNYRDLAADAAAGRHTLAAVLGPARARRLYAVLLLLPLAFPLWLALHTGFARVALTTMVMAPLVLSLIVRMHRRQGPALNPVLGQTALAQLAFGLLLAGTLLL
jgi:1,4-dihydroxy-2-naphthoate octaprenyltransferase